MSLVRRRLVGQWWPGVAAVTLGALAVRWYMVLVRQPTCGADGPRPDCFQIDGDALYHFTQARLIGDGHFFKNGAEYLATGRVVESAGDPPLFALLLGSWSALGFDTVGWQRFLLGFVGGAGVVLIAMVARRLGGDRAGWIAAAIAAVHPLLWVNDTRLMSESLFQPVVAVVMMTAVAYADQPTTKRAVGVGVAVAVAALVRGEAALLGIVLLGPLMGLARTLRLRNRGRHLLMAGGAAVVVVAPWIVYNNIRFAEPVTLTSAPGSVLMAGSCDSVWSGPGLGFWRDCFTERGLWDEYEAAFPGIIGTGGDRTVYDESRIDAFNRRHAFDYIADNLSRYPVVMLARVGRVMEVFRVGDTLRSNWALEERGKRPSTAGLGFYYALVGPAIVGAVILRRAGKRLTPLLAWWPMVIVTAAVTFGLTRYRVPVDMAMIILAGVGMAARPRARARLATDPARTEPLADPAEAR